MEHNNNTFFIYNIFFYKIKNKITIRNGVLIIFLPIRPQNIAMQNVQRFSVFFAPRENLQCGFFFANLSGTISIGKVSGYS